MCFYYVVHDGISITTPKIIFFFVDAFEKMIWHKPNYKFTYALSAAVEF